MTDDDPTVNRDDPAEGEELERILDEQPSPTQAHEEDDPESDE
jgi:hypothetical protein